MELLEAKKPNDNPSDQLRQLGWKRVGGFPIHRLQRRVTINRLGKIGILTRSGYKTSLAYARRQMLLHEYRQWFGDSYVGLKAHLMEHARWRGAILIVAESAISKRSLGHSFGLWAFVPKTDIFIDPLDFEHLFNGTGLKFATPGGNRKKISQQWRVDAERETAYGLFSPFGRDRSMLKFYCDRFLPQFLPAMNLPETCHIFSVIRHERYY
ncbi:MAG: hypothetical protein AAF066_17240 [Pseudomonadota bacterium]